jgi:GT2 family glycosyltransferase
MRNCLAIGIVSFERPRLTQRCIDSIREAAQVPYRIYIADNGSASAEARSFMARWEEDKDVILVRLGTNGGPSAGRNAVLDAMEARHEFVAMLDNDVIVLSNWDTAALQALGEGYDVVCPKLLSADLRRVDRGPTRPWPERWLVHPEYVGRGCDRHDPLIASRTEVEVFPGVAIFRTSVFDRAGRYDPGIWIAEDYELAFRAAAAGVRICYEPTCEIVHDHGFDPTYEKARHDPEREVKAHLLFWQKHGKLLLSPSALRFYCHLVEKAEPMWIPKTGRFDKIGTRLWRRIVRQYYQRRYGEVWSSLSEGEAVTAEIRARIEGKTRPRSAAAPLRER